MFAYSLKPILFVVGTKALSKYLKVVSATFLLVSFSSVNESTYQTRKSLFYFTSKAHSALEKIKF